jgi:hypothetical protein
MIVGNGPYPYPYERGLCRRVAYLQAEYAGTQAGLGFADIRL